MTSDPFPSPEAIEAAARDAFWSDDLGGHIKGGWTWDTIADRGRANYRKVAEAALRAATKAQPVVAVDDHDGDRCVWLCEQCGEPLGAGGRCSHRRVHVGGPMAVASTDVVAQLRAKYAAPTCPTCDGDHRVSFDGESVPCPSCKGLGVDRLIPESEIREWIANYREDPQVDTRDSKTAGWALDDLTSWLDEREARQ